jgi:transcriptional regulator with XRE-family HTH domain
MAHEIDVFVGQRIREERKRAGLSLEELSALIGVRFQQLHKYETASNRVSASRLWGIATALEQPVEIFFPAPSTKP